MADAKESWTPPQEFDEYRLVRVLGRGAMGQVYLAHDTLLDRPVAVKFISKIDPESGDRDRLLVEARAAARLQHPNVVAIHRVGVLGQHPYLVSEFVRGESLNKLAKPVPWRRVLTIALGLARGLATAHRRGVLHRDLKPHNAMITEDGEPKLLDFGLAKLTDHPTDIIAYATTGKLPTLEVASADLKPGFEDTLTPPPPRGEATIQLTATPVATPVPSSSPANGSPALTRVGVVMGTPFYMAPEIWRGEAASRRSDIYSFGALLYELCADKAPNHDIAVPDLPKVVQDRDPPPLLEVAPDVEPRFAAIVMRCLARDPQERFASADELREALDQLAPTSGGIAIPEGNPYRGLQAFEVEHRGLFFGRRGEIHAIVERLRSEHFMLVAGDSGVGKSSLCRAGVLPAFCDADHEGRAWQTVRVIPGRRPRSTLAEGVASILGRDAEIAKHLAIAPAELGRQLAQALGPKRGVVILIDQLEELVTLGEPDEAEAIGEAMAEIARGVAGVRVIGAVRGDFLTRVVSAVGLGEDVTRALYLLRPLSPDRVREAITGPARATGVKFESDELVDELVESCTRAGGGLPLLQFALAELWEARDLERRLITRAALDRIGGVGGALARHADGVLAGMIKPQREAARSILIALVTVEGTRARRTEPELVADDATAKVALDALVRGRLVVAREGNAGAEYEVAHEALITGWSTLAGWLDSQAEGRIVKLRIEAAAAEWDRLGRSRDALWSARQLTEVRDPGGLRGREVSFLAESRRAVRRRRWARNGAIVGVPLLVVGAIGASLYGKHRADAEARRELADKLDRQLVTARGALTQARGHEATYDDARTRAFAAFDARDRAAGEGLWQEALAAADDADRSYSRASETLESAVVLDPTRDDTKALLADLLLARALLAESARRPAREVSELVHRLALYDDGSRTRRWEAPAHLELAVSPREARVIELSRYVSDANGKRRPEPAGSLSGFGIDLAPGSYLVVLAADGYATVRYPILLGRGERRRIAIELPPASAVPDGYAYIPPGQFLFGSGGDDVLRRTFLATVPLHAIETGGYLIAKHEVTYADWIEYLRALPQPEREQRRPKVAAAGFHGAMDLQEVGGAWQLAIEPTVERYRARVGERIHYKSRDRRRDQDWLRFPVSGVAFADATAYAAWLDSTGRTRGARLCTEHEWERAARGADDREYPHGDRLDPDDANYDETYGKQPAAFGPDEVGAHPASTSPFGVDDMTGNVFEWVVSAFSRDEHLARGAAYYFDAMGGRVVNRVLSEPSLRDITLGVRICADLRPR